MFQLEPEDLKELQNIEQSIQKGGQIFFAIDDESGEVMACCMVAPREDGDWEIMKFAANQKFAGKGAGNNCLKACVDYAKNLGIPKILIASNRKCVNALHLYRKNGFREIPVDKKKFPFNRGDVAFGREL